MNDLSYVTLELHKNGTRKEDNTVLFGNRPAGITWVGLERQAAEVVSVFKTNGYSMEEAIEELEKHDAIFITSDRRKRGSQGTGIMAEFLRLVWPAA